MKIMGHTPHATNLRDLLILRAEYGEKPLLIIRDRILTYADADRLSNIVANQLMKYGVRKGDVVATFMYNSLEQALIWFGCAKMGAVYAPLNVSLVRDDLAYSLNDTGATLFILDEELTPAYNAAKSLLTFDPKVFVLGDIASVENTQAELFENLTKGNAELPDIEVKSTDPMAIVYTGGSTSMPKGVLVSHLYYIGAAIRYAEIAEATEDDIHFANSHFFHIGGQQFAITGPLYNGMTGIMEKWFSASRYWDICRKYGVTIIDPIGTMIAVLLRQPPSDLDQKHKVKVGVGVASGQVRGALHQEFERRFGAPMLEVYAMTEVGVLICSERLNDRREGSSGKPHGWAEVMVVDQDDNPVPPNTLGQLLLRPQAINTYMIEYVNKPKETLAAWKNLWYHSGDLGYLDEDGYVYFVGREAHWIRRRGENVSAFEVEKALTEHPAITDCAVVGVPSDVGDEDIKAYIQITEGAERPSPLELTNWCKEKIAYFKTPRYIEFVHSFPRTMTKNEIARHALRELGIGSAWDAALDDWIEEK